MEEEVTARKNKKAEEAESKKHLFEAKAEDSNFRYDDYPVLPGQTDVADGTKAVAEETGHNLPGPANPNQPPGARITPDHSHDV